jgi:predicted nuclease of predicted toxin-antitoxin system
LKFKLDENLGGLALETLKSAGFDTMSVADQELCGTPDSNLADICRAEGRTLVTMDVEFANPLLYPPHEYRGIVLIRLHGRPTRELIQAAIETLREGLLTKDNPAGSSIPLKGPDRHLWIVEPGRIRLYQGDPELPN